MKNTNIYDVSLGCVWFSFRKMLLPQKEKQIPTTGRSISYFLEVIAFT
jgi:hypothetical protein